MTIVREPSFVAFTYRGSPATPLDACSAIEDSLNDTIAIIIRNETNKDCHVAKQVNNVVGSFHFFI